jgi:TPR repeat protein
VYRDGAGVAADPTEANRWLRRAAESGNPDAQLELAAVLEADKSIVDAYTWYVIAWQAGKTEAESAIRRLTPSLSAPEIAQVRYNVGKAYASGQALPRDAVSAYVWYSLADWGGDAKARDRLKELEQQLTPQQLGEAKSRAAAWIRRHTTRPNTTAPAVSSGP